MHWRLPGRAAPVPDDEPTTHMMLWLGFDTVQYHVGCTSTHMYMPPAACPIGYARVRDEVSLSRGRRVGVKSLLKEEGLEADTSLRHPSQR